MEGGPRSHRRPPQTYRHTPEASAMHGVGAKISPYGRDIACSVDIRRSSPAPASVAPRARGPAGCLDRRLARPAYAPGPMGGVGERPSELSTRVFPNPAGRVYGRVLTVDAPYRTRSPEHVVRTTGRATTITGVPARRVRPVLRRPYTRRRLLAGVRKRPPRENSLPLERRRSPARRSAPLAGRSLARPSRASKRRRLRGFRTSPPGATGARPCFLLTADGSANLPPWSPVAARGRRPASVPRL